MVKRVEAELGVSLTDEDLRGDLPYVLQVFLHEVCHAALGKRVPSLRKPYDPAVDLIDEVVVRLLEDELGAGLGFPIHTPEEHAREIATLNPPVQVSPEQYRHLQRKWIATSVYAELTADGTREEPCAAHPDALVAPAARLLVEALFPRLASFLYSAG